MTDALVDNIKRFLVGLADVFNQFIKFFEKYFRRTTVQQLSSRKLIA